MDEDERQMYTAPVRVEGLRSTGVEARADDAVVDDALLALAKQRAPDASVFDEYVPYFVDVIASNDRLDAYYTQMDRTTLDNFAADASEGRSVLDSHSSGGFFSESKLGFGQSLTGEVTKVKGEQQMRSSFYTIPGLNASGTDSQSYINGIRAGIYRDVSVGFSIPREPEAGAMIKCSVCGNDVRDWQACGHFPGMTYDVDIDDTTKEKRIATATIIGARLHEYSLVYDGATPGAGVVKAERMIAAGEIDARVAGQLEQVYHRQFPTVARSFAVTTNLPPASSTTQRDERKDTNDMEWAERMTELLKERKLRIRSGADDEALFEQLRGHLADLDTDREADQQEIARLQPMAEDGEAYREAVVDEALDNLVRTYPPDEAATFNRDVQKRYLMSLEIADIRSLSGQWEKTAVFQEGRQSSDQGRGGNPPVDKPKNEKRPRARRRG